MGQISGFYKQVCLRQVCLFFTAALILLTAIGCKRQEENHTPKQPLVVVSIPPYIEIVRAIAKDSVDIESVIQIGYNPHTSETTPRQMERLQEAVLWIGIGEPYEEKLMAALRKAKSPIRMIAMQEKIPLLLPTDHTDCTGAYKKKPHSPFKEARDTHFWLSPKRLGLQATLIAEALIKLLPEKEQEYREHLHSYLENIKRLDHKLTELLRPFAHKSIIVSHAALGYFCYDYTLVQIAIECEGKRPLSKRISQLLSHINPSDVQCAFIFHGHSNKGALLITERLNLKTFKINLLSPNLSSTIEQLAIDIATPVLTSPVLTPSALTTIGA